MVAGAAAVTLLNERAHPDLAVDRGVRDLRARCGIGRAQRPQRCDRGRDRRRRDLGFAANGFRCPLTDLAESQGAARGSVTDIYLPAWFARTFRPSTRRSSFWLSCCIAGTCAAAGRCLGPPG
jgi:hypothetical protein